MGDILTPTPDDVLREGPKFRNDRVTSVAYKLNRGAEVTLSELTTFLESLAPPSNEGLPYYVKKVADGVAKERKIKLFPILWGDSSKIMVGYIPNSEQPNQDSFFDLNSVKLVCEFELGNAGDFNQKSPSTEEIRQKIEAFFEKQDMHRSIRDTIDAIQKQFTGL